jgi:hypothetical protein
MASFDFGFTLVDEADLDVAKEVAASTASASNAQDRLDKLFNAITPYLIILRLILRKNILNGLIG